MAIQLMFIGIVLVGMFLAGAEGNKKGKSKR